MFGIGGFELFLIVLFAFLLFGPDRIPVFLKTLRKAVTKFREAEQEVSAALKQEVIDPETGETAADVLDSLTGKSGTPAKKRSASSETFAARKARYERERLEREKRERERAEREQAARGKAADEDGAQVSESSEAPVSSDASDASDASVSKEAPAEGAAAKTIDGVSIEELYSMKPVAAADATGDVATGDAAAADATGDAAAADATSDAAATDAGKEA